MYNTYYVLLTNLLLGTYKHHTGNTRYTQPRARARTQCLRTHPMRMTQEHEHAACTCRYNNLDVPKAFNKSIWLLDCGDRDLQQEHNNVNDKTTRYMPILFFLYLLLFCFLLYSLSYYNIELPVLKHLLPRLSLFFELGWGNHPLEQIVCLCTFFHSYIHIMISSTLLFIYFCSLLLSCIYS